MSLCGRKLQCVHDSDEKNGLRRRNSQRRRPSRSAVSWVTGNEGKITEDSSRMQGMREARVHNLDPLGSEQHLGKHKVVKIVATGKRL